MKLCRCGVSLDVNNESAFRFEVYEFSGFFYSSVSAIHWFGKGKGLLLEEKDCSWGKMPHQKARGSPAFQAPGDFRYDGSQESGKTMTPDIASKQDNGNGTGDVGSGNDESPYCNLDVSTKDGCSSGDTFKAPNTPIRSLKQSYVESRLNDATTPYKPKKVLEKLPKSSVRKRLFNDVLERPIWNPAGVEHVRVVKEALHVSTAPESVVCRENEQSMILDFCKKCVKQEKAGSMYICGCPGTGKSLSIEIIKKILVNWANEEEIQPPDILSMNCMIFAQTTEVFSKILRKHFPQKEPNCSKLPLQLLHNLYSEKQTPDVKMILVIVDELDYLITKDRTVLHDLFMLTTMPFSRCILLGIANAIDLADRFMPKLRCLNCKPVVITFRAYSKDQIIMILKDRLETLPYTVFEPQAVELCAGRVAATSGDMRKALSVCRSAIGMLEAEIRDSISNKSLSSTRKNDDQLKSADLDWLTSRGNNLVRIDHVAAALSKTFKSPVVDTIQSLPQHQQIILCSVVKLFRAAKKDTTVGELNKCYRDVCKSTSVPPVSIMELSSMCRVLDDQGIIKLGQSREDKLRRVALKVDSTEIAFALQGVRFFRNCLQ